MIYCTVIKTEALRFILKLRIKIAARVLFACASPAAPMVGKGDIQWPTTTLRRPVFSWVHNLASYSKVESQLNSQSFSSPKSPMNLQCEIQRKPKTGERQMYLSCTDDVGRRQKILSSVPYWLQNKGTVINQQEYRLRGNIDWIWRNFSFLKELFSCKGNQESFCKLEWQPASLQPIWVSFQAIQKNIHQMHVGF